MTLLLIIPIAPIYVSLSINAMSRSTMMANSFLKDCVISNISNQLDIGYQLALN